MPCVCIVPAKQAYKGVVKLVWKIHMLSTRPGRKDMLLEQGLGLERWACTDIAAVVATNTYRVRVPEYHPCGQFRSSPSRCHAQAGKRACNGVQGFRGPDGQDAPWPRRLSEDTVSNVYGSRCLATRL